jgi:hypothetical protein
LCDALIAAAFSFFSAMRFAIRALKDTQYERKCEGKDKRDALVLRLLLLLVFEPVKLNGAKVPTTLETQGCDQPLDFWTVSIDISYLCFASYK